MYTQIYEQVRGAILAGKVPADEKLPTEADLAGYLKVSRGTVTRAWHFLEKDGLIVWSVGKGKFTPTQPDIDRVAKVKKR